MGLGGGHACGAWLQPPGLAHADNGRWRAADACAPLAAHCCAPHVCMQADTATLSPDDREVQRVLRLFASNQSAWDVVYTRAYLKMVTQFANFAPSYWVSKQAPKASCETHACCCGGATYGMHAQ